MPLSTTPPPPAASDGRRRRCSGVSTYQLLRFLGHPACGFLPACCPSHSSFFGKNSMCASTRSHSRFRYFRRASKCSRGTAFLFSLSISICILFTWVSIPLIQLYRSSSNLFILSSNQSAGIEIVNNAFEFLNPSLQPFDLLCCNGKSGKCHIQGITFISKSLDPIIDLSCYIHLG